MSTSTDGPDMSWVGRALDDSATGPAPLGKGPAPLGKVQVPTAAEEACDRITTAIAVGDFLPGERLPTERELAELLGISRTTVREAIGRLRDRGMLEVRRGRSGGTYVCQTWADGSAEAVRRTMLPRLPELEHLLDLRARLEGAIAQAAAERCDADRAGQLRAALAEYERVWDQPEARTADARLHRIIVETAANPYLAELSEQTRRRIGLGLPLEPWLPGGDDEARAEHRALIGAITAGQGPEAAALARDHFGFTERMLREAIDRSLAEE